jgi:hypothetical protein
MMLPDTSQSALLSALAGANGEEPPSLPDLIARLGERDPRLALVASCLMRARAESGDHAVTDDDDEDDGSSAALAELAILRERSDALAQALGACEHCWGADGSCRGCRGRGGPGAFLPDADLFAELVLPAFRRLRRQQTRSPTAERSDPPAAADVSNPTPAPNRRRSNERERI